MKLTFFIEYKDLSELNKDKLKESIIALRSRKYRKNRFSLLSSSYKSACCLGVVALEVDNTSIKDIENLNMPCIGYSNFSYTLGQLNIKITSTPILIEDTSLSALNDGVTRVLGGEVFMFRATHPQIAKLLETGKLTLQGKHETGWS